MFDAVLVRGPTAVANVGSEAINLRQFLSKGVVGFMVGIGQHIKIAGPILQLGAQ